MTLTIRVSSLPGYPDCERRSIAKAFPRLIEAAGFRLRQLPRGIAAAIGTGVHKGAEFTLKAKLATGTLGGAADTEEVALLSMREEAAAGVEYDKATGNLNDGEKQVRRMVAMYRRVVAPQIHPSFVVTRLYAKVTDSIELTGQSDVMAAEPDKIRDTKTGVAPRANHGQLGGYSLIARSNGLPAPKMLLEDFIQRVPVAKDQPPPITVAYDVKIAEATAWQVIDRMVQSLNEFESRCASGMKPPEYAFLANPYSKLCSAKFCPAYGTTMCKEWRPA